MSKPLCLILCICVSTVTAAELSEKFARKLSSAEETYKTAVQKADNVRFFAVQKADQDRTKALKAALIEATKAGDFDAATEIKARLSSSDLASAIAEVEWQAPSLAEWGRFVFKSDRTVHAELLKHEMHWFPIDDNNVLIAHYRGKQISVDRFAFSKDRTTVTAYGLTGRAEWDAVKIKQ